MSGNLERIRPDVEAFYVVEIRLSAGKNGLVFYSLYVNDDQPITVGGRPIVFANPASSALALQGSDFSAASELPIPTGVSCIFDFAEALRALDDESTAILVDSGVLNCLNALLDFTKLLTLPLPYQYTLALGDLADYLTFSMDIGKFFASRSIHRAEVAMMFRTCLGAVLCEVTTYCDPVRIERKL